LLKKIASAVLLAFLATSLLAASFEARKTKPTNITATGNTWIVPIHFDNITAAINSELVADGDIIEVVPKGTPYYENVTVNKRLTIRRWSEATPGDYPIVDGGNKKGVVFNVTVPDVEIDGFVVRNGFYGIFLSSASASNRILNTTITSNIYNIFIDCANNYLRENKITGNMYNFGVSYPLTCNVSFPLSHYIQDIDDSNTVNGKPICYWVNKTETDGKIPTNAGYVAIVNSTGIVAENLSSLQNNYQGVLVAYSSEITVKNFQCIYPFISLECIVFATVNNSLIQNITFSYIENCIVFSYVNNSSIQNSTFSDNENCILLRNSKRNIIQNNKVFSGMYAFLSVAIELDWSDYNAIFDNSINIQLTTGTGVYSWCSVSNSIIANSITNACWSMKFKSSNASMIVHNNFSSLNKSSVDQWSFNNSFDNGYEGNYWSDYTGNDPDGNGIGNSPYAIDGVNKDNYPLINPWSAYRVFNRPMTKIIDPYLTQKLYTYSNSTLGNAPLGFTFSNTTKTLSLKLTSGYSGFLNMTIPRNWLDGPFTVTIDSIQISPEIRQDEKNSYIPITYDSGHHILTIKGTKLGCIAGDINEDGYVNYLDAIILGANFGAVG
jgi:parallel beta-helix repeat protein